MAQFQRYIAANGKSVTRFRTTTGMTAYVVDEIPTEALIAWRADLAARLDVPPREEGHEEGQDGPDAPTAPVGDRRS